jgi:transposase
MQKEEIKLTKQQYEIVKVVAEAVEGIKTKDIAKQFGVQIQKVNGSIRGLLKKGIIEADEESDSHSPLYCLRPDIEINEQEEQGKIKVYAKSAV